MISKTVAAGWSLLNVETVNGLIPNIVNETMNPANAALEWPTRIDRAKTTVLMYKRDPTVVSAETIENPDENIEPPIAKGFSQWMIPSWTLPSD